MDMLTFSEKNGELTAKISGELDHFLASDVRGRIDDMMARKMPSALILDISGVTFMDSSGLGLIMGRYTACKSRGASFRLHGAIAFNRMFTFIPQPDSQKSGLYNRRATKKRKDI